MPCAWSATGSRIDPDLAVDAALAGNRGDALDAKQPLADSIVDVPAELLEAHVGGFGGDEQDRVAGDVDAGHLRLENPVGQVGPRTWAMALRTSLTARSVGVPISNMDEGVAVALADRAVDLLDAVDSADRGLDPLGDLHFHLARRRAGLRDVDVDRREIDVRVVVDLHAHEGHEAGQQQPDEQHDRRNRVADAPGRDVAEIHRTLALLNTLVSERPAASARPSAPG